MNQLLIQQQKPTEAVPASRLHRHVRGASGSRAIAVLQLGGDNLYHGSD